MKSSKAIFFAALFALLAGVGFFKVKMVQAADCNLTITDFQKIATVQNDPSLSYLDEIKQELALRKQLIAKTVTCAQEDVQSLKSELANAPVDGDSMDLRAQLSGRLDDTANFYNIEIVKLNEVGISGSVAIAKDLLAWRKSNYDPLSGQVNNFILWSQNQNLFTTAQSRMNQTQRAVAFLEDASPNPDLQKAFNDASSLLATAERQNASAKTALGQFLPPDQSLALIKQSLDSLSTTYQKFFDVSNLIKGVLPQ